MMMRIRRKSTIQGILIKKSNRLNRNRLTEENV